jgi:hypothetical protein
MDVPPEISLQPAADRGALALARLNALFISDASFWREVNALESFLRTYTWLPLLRNYAQKHSQLRPNLATRGVHTDILLADAADAVYGFVAPPARRTISTNENVSRGFDIWADLPELENDPRVRIRRTKITVPKRYRGATVLTQRTSAPVVPLLIGRKRRRSASPVKGEKTPPAARTSAKARSNTVRVPVYYANMLFFVTRTSASGEPQLRKMNNITPFLLDPFAVERGVYTWNTELLRQLANGTLSYARSFGDTDPVLGNVDAGELAPVAGSDGFVLELRPIVSEEFYERFLLDLSTAIGYEEQQAAEEEETPEVSVQDMQQTWKEWFERNNYQTVAACIEDQELKQFATDKNNQQLRQLVFSVTTLLRARAEIRALDPNTTYPLGSAQERSLRTLKSLICALVRTRLAKQFNIVRSSAFIAEQNKKPQASRQPAPKEWDQSIYDKAAIEATAELQDFIK